MTGWAYAISMIIYNVCGLFFGVPFTFWTVVGFVFLAGLIFGLVRKGFVPDNSVRSLTSVDAARA